tara:strand:- start:44 stop:1177 length:1134 start_codon:yes stop_codon:yes gene_type:complete
MEHFVPKDGQYEITADQKTSLEKFIREKLIDNENSKKGVTHKTKIGDQLHIMKNRGNKIKPIWNLKPIKQVEAERIRRDNALNYADITSEEKRKGLKFLNKKNVDPEFADEAYMLDIPTYEEHGTAVQSGVKMPKGIGTDDIENVKLRTDAEFDYNKIKAAKDDLEGAIKGKKLPWHATYNEITDEMIVVNIEEWKAKNDGEFVDIMRDGVSLDNDEVKQWKKVLDTGKLGKFPKGKARYLLKGFIEKVKMNPAARAAIPAAVFALFDAVGLKAGVHTATDKKASKLEKLGGYGEMMSGASGLASLLNPALAPVAMTTGTLTSIAKNRVDRENKKKAAIDLFLNPKNIQANTPSGNAVLGKPARQLSLRSRYRHGKR